jgi:hypothetical protein
MPAESFCEKFVFSNKFFKNLKVFVKKVKNLFSPISKLYNYSWGIAQAKTNYKAEATREKRGRHFNVLDSNLLHRMLGL